MAVRKTAIAMPAELLAAVDAAALERGESRSGFISRVLREVVRVRRDADITRRLDALFRDEALQAEQLRCVSDLDAAADETPSGVERW